MDNAVIRHVVPGASLAKRDLKARTTDQAARAIIEAESRRREAKTTRLRQARLDQESRQVASAPTGGSQRGRARKA